jgi:uncharacterized delta-60 repeat protein
VRAGRFVCGLLLGLSCLGVAGGSAVAAPGDIDRAFGQEGIATLSSASGDFVSPNDMVVGPGDAIYVLRTDMACGAFLTCPLPRLVTRLTPGGSLDPAFGHAGTATAPAGEGRNPEAASLAVGHDGKVVVAAASGKGVALARLNPDGSPDATFGTGGLALTGLGFEADRIRVAVGKDDKIVVAAEAGFAYREPVVSVTRYTPQGAPDVAFNGGAPVMTTLGSGLGGFDLGEDGGAVVAGPRCCELSGNSVHITRLASDGTFDSGFGSRGQRFVDDVAPAAAVGSVSVLRDGRIVVIGAGHNGRPFALRLLPDGRLDRRFGNRGIAHAKSRFTSDTEGALDGRGRLLIAGTMLRGTGGGPLKRLGLLRRLRDGRPDRTFGGGGTVGLPTFENASLVGIGVQSGGRIVVLAEVGNCERSCAIPKTLVIRYLGGDSGARCLEKKATIVGTRNGERLMGTPRRDVITAGAGNDVVLGRGGNDLICGGRGNDRLIGGGGRDRLLRGAGRNHLQP